MDGKSNAPDVMRIAYFDGAIAFGGSLEVLSMLFGAVDRRLISPMLITYVPLSQLHAKFVEADVAVLRSPLLNYVGRERLTRRIPKKCALLRKLAAYLFTLAACLTGLPDQVRLFRHLSRTRPHLIHINNSFAPLIVAKLLKIKILWHIHGIPEAPSPWQRWQLSSVTCFVAISHYVAKQAVAAGYPEDKIVTIHNPAPRHTALTHESRKPLHSAYGIPESHKLIVHPGRLVRWKGQLEFLVAFAEVVKRYPSVTALIIGGDSESFGAEYALTLQEFIGRHNLDGQAILTGHINNSLEAIGASDIVVHSSIQPEPFGLIVTEAMSMGIPVIASTLGAPKEIIVDGETGFLVDPTDARALSEKMLDLLTSADLRHQFGEGGKKFVETNLSLESYSQKLLVCYLRTV